MTTRSHLAAAQPARSVSRMANNLLAAFIVLALAVALGIGAPASPTWPRYIAIGLAVLSVLVLLLVR